MLTFSTFFLFQNVRNDVSVDLTEKEGGRVSVCVFFLLFFLVVTWFLGGRHKEIRKREVENPFCKSSQSQASRPGQVNFLFNMYFR